MRWGSHTVNLLNKKKICHFYFLLTSEIHEHIHTSNALLGTISHISLLWYYCVDGVVGQQLTTAIAKVTE